MSTHTQSQRNLNLINQDATSCFEDFRDEQVNPFGKKFFTDMVDLLNIKY